MNPVMKRSLETLTDFGSSASNLPPVNDALCGIEYNEFMTIWIGFEQIDSNRLAGATPGILPAITPCTHLFCTCIKMNGIFSAIKSKNIIFWLGSADAESSTLLRVGLMWFKIDFSAILGGFIGLMIMLIVIALFSSPQAIGQFLSYILP